MTTDIPAVKDQVRRWATGRSEKDADKPGRETIAARDLKILGKVARSQFATLRDGREVKLRGPAQPFEIEQAPADAVLVTRQARDSQGRVRTDTFIGRVVEAGTFERLQRQKTYRPKPRRVGPIDALAEHRTPARRLPIVLGKDDDSPEGVIKGALSRLPSFVMTDGMAAPMTVRRLIERANEAGANLRHYKGRSLADWTRAGRWYAHLVAAWPLVDAHLAGEPLRCSYEHKGKTAPVADTLDPAGNPTCNPHVGEGPLSE